MAVYNCRKRQRFFRDSVPEPVRDRDVDLAINHAVNAQLRLRNPLLSSPSFVST